MVNKEYSKVMDQLEDNINILNKFINRLQDIHLYNKRIEICTIFPEFIFQKGNISYAIPIKECR